MQPELQVSASPEGPEEQHEVGGSQVSPVLLLRVFVVLLPWTQICEFTSQGL